MSDIPTLPPTPQPTPEQVENVITQLENRFGAPNGSIASIIVENDWSFVVKAHALIEGAISVLLAARTDDVLHPLFARLPLGEKDFGKLQFVTALGLLSKEQIAFVKKLSELRNLVAHDPRNLVFTFASYISQLDKNQQRAFFEVIIHVTPPPHAEYLKKVRKTVRDNPKLMIMVGVVAIITACETHIVRGELETERLRWRLTKPST